MPVHSQPRTVADSHTHLHTRFVYMFACVCVCVCMSVWVCRFAQRLYPGDCNWRKVPRVPSLSIAAILVQGFLSAFTHVASMTGANFDANLDGRPYMMRCPPLLRSLAYDARMLMTSS